MGAPLAKEVYSAAKTIEDTVAAELLPIWDCTDDNIASEKTALRCGYEKVREDPVYWFGV